MLVASGFYLMEGMVWASVFFPVFFLPCSQTPDVLHAMRDALHIVLSSIEDLLKRVRLPFPCERPERVVDATSLLMSALPPPRSVPVLLCGGGRHCPKVAVTAEPHIQHLLMCVRGALSSIYVDIGSAPMNLF